MNTNTKLLIYEPRNIKLSSIHNFVIAKQKSEYLSNPESGQRNASHAVDELHHTSIVDEAVLD